MPSSRRIPFRYLLHASTALVLTMTSAPSQARFSGARVGQAEKRSEENRDATDFKADELRHDRKLGILKAVGDVEIAHENRILRADVVVYNERTDVMTASGNVTLLEPSGEVVFAEYVEMTRDLKKGAIRDMLVVLADKSRIAALDGKREDGNKTEMTHAIYTACGLCEKDPARPPLWQLKSIKVVHDKKRRTIEYKDAWLEIAGIPVAYTPYLTHPDPTVKRRSGFLPASVGSSSDLGTIVRIPYFWAISDQSDATITPMYASDEGAGLHAEIRHRMKKGRFALDGSGAMQDDNNLDGHVDATFRYDIDRTWRAGFDARRAVDDTYLRRYGYDHDQTLTSRMFVEGFRGRNYVSASTYAFQNLESGNDKGKIPKVLPLLEYNYMGEPDAIGGYTDLAAGLVSLVRSDGADTRRLSLHGGWHFPFLGPFGAVMGVNTVLRTDTYHKSHFKPNGRTKEDNGFEERIRPEASLDIAYPLAKSDGRHTQTVEPRAQMIISPHGGNSSGIPNEDSRTIELDDTRLFSHSRYSGLDRVEGGPRINYGLRWGLYGPTGSGATSFIGQSFRFKEDGGIPEGSGLEGRLSDIVAMVHVAPGEWVDILYRARLDQSDFDFNRNEIQATFGKPLLSFSTRYSFFEAQSDGEFKDREEILYDISSRFTEYWRGSLSGVTDLDEGGELLSLGASLTYEDECLVFGVVAKRSFYEDRDLQPTDQITFGVSLKTLGDFDASASL